MKKKILVLLFALLSISLNITYATNRWSWTIQNHSGKTLHASVFYGNKGDTQAEDITDNSNYHHNVGIDGNSFDFGIAIGPYVIIFKADNDYIDYNNAFVKLHLIDTRHIDLTAGAAHYTYSASIFGPVGTSKNDIRFDDTMPFGEDGGGCNTFGGGCDVYSNFLIYGVPSTPPSMPN